jgi:hypothetical protein
MLSDHDLQAMAEEDRHELLRRLVELTGDVSLTKGRVQRERYVAITAFSAIFLIGWVVYLAAILPHTYTTGHWRLTWVGFDCALAATLAATAALALWRKQLVILTSMIAGSLLLCDAWFDVTTAAGSDRWLSWLSVPIETGLSAMLLGTAAVLLRHLSSVRPDASQSRWLGTLAGVTGGGWKPTLGALRGRKAEGN